jgi:hypothetical protein
LLYNQSALHKYPGSSELKARGENMAKEVIRLATEEELASLDKNNFFIKFKLELGPAFSERRDLTNGQLLDLLREHSAHWKGFVGPLLQHFAEHIEFNGRQSDAARLHMNSTYYGCGSCCADNVQGSLCTSDDGTTTCDKVCGSDPCS